MLNKKGDLTIRYVILFALALIVLVVIALIFYGGASNFADKVKEIFEGIWKTKPEEIIKPIK